MVTKHSRTSFWFLVLYNIVTNVFALHLGWGIEEFLVVYYLQSLVFTIFFLRTALQEKRVVIFTISTSAIVLHLVYLFLFFDYFVFVFTQSSNLLWLGFTFLIYLCSVYVESRRGVLKRLLAQERPSLHLPQLLMRRIVPMHILLLIGGWLGSGLAFFVVCKSVLEIFLSYCDHSKIDSKINR